MTSRARLVIGNWKMNLSPSAAATFVAAFGGELASLPASVGIGLAPAFPALERVGRAVRGTAVLLGAQNVHGEKEGAFTGEVSAGMLKDLGVAFCLVGHSERRRYQRETEAELARKMERLVETGISPVYCVGETLEEREAGATEKILARQLTALDGLSAPHPGLVLAYEPVWAIGTGRTATDDQAQEVHAFLRGVLTQVWGASAAASVRIQYGGSVKAENATGLMAKPDVDGALVGGASLKADSFAAIVNF